MVAQINSKVIKTQPLLIHRRLTSYFLFEGRPLTTRGQWINPLLFRMFKLALKLPSPKEVVKPIIIIGTGRSGSTILGMLFHMHPTCGFLNEPKAMWHVIYPYEDIIGSYSRGPAYYRLGEKDATPVVKKRAHRLYSHYLFLTGAKRVVDKYPEMVFRIPFLRAIFSDARFILLIRNGYDTIASIASWSLRNKKKVGKELHDWWGVDNRKWHMLLEQIVPFDDRLSPYQDRISKFNSQEEMAAVEWIISIREGLRNLACLPDSIYPLYYESLTRNPREELLKLIEFCGLEENEVFLSYAEEVLIPAKPKSIVPLPDFLRDAVEETNQELGYTTGNFVLSAKPLFRS